MSPRNETHITLKENYFTPKRDLLTRAERSLIEFVEDISAADANWCISLQQGAATGMNRLAYPRFQLHPLYLREVSGFRV
jgi:hypothetical protein